ncbi:MAG: hypothetical protein PHR06_11515 [Candidatus Cloacimonetes bacterium]|nr:hypothetical protein [Candidatus Cloacimonadota bacterium]
MKDVKKKDINPLCENCEKKCKQSSSVVLISCPNFEMKPKQLTIKFEYRKKK